MSPIHPTEHNPPPSNGRQAPARTQSRDEGATTTPPQPCAHATTLHHAGDHRLVHPVQSHSDCHGSSPPLVRQVRHSTARDGLGRLPRHHHGDALPPPRQPRDRGVLGVIATIRALHSSPRTPPTKSPTTLLRQLLQEAHRARAEMPPGVQHKGAPPDPWGQRPIVRPPAPLHVTARAPPGGSPAATGRCAPHVGRNTDTSTTRVDPRPS